MLTKGILFGINILTLGGFIVVRLNLTLQRTAAAGRQDPGPETRSGHGNPLVPPRPHGVKSVILIRE